MSSGDFTANNLIQNVMSRSAKKPKCCHGWAESLEVVLGHESTSSLQLPAFLIKAPFLSINTCLLNYWLVSGVQPNLSSVRIPSFSYATHFTNAQADPILALTEPAQWCVR